jgi:precorrin-8X/cobalt-precorrin-8 methylmutase
MPPVFDAYIMVDWSAAATPRTGEDSIWYCCLERQNGQLMPVRLANPATRRQAVAELADLLSDLIARGCHALAGFDFAFGYPAGFAARLRPNAPNWLSVWKEIAGRVRDGDDNVNNRFEVAAALNEKISGGDFPFWGCPDKTRRPNLGKTKPEGFGGGGLAELRMTERAIPGPQPVWKLHYQGSVGSQTLTGIPCVFSLRHHPWLADATRIWPFETGLGALEKRNTIGRRLVFAEVYPSMIRPRVQSGDIKDAVQVRALAEHFAHLDGAGALAPLFAGPQDLSSGERHVIETEEGWILGVEKAAKGARPPAAATSRYGYVRDPRDIYRRSFEAIRAEARLGDLPADFEPLAVRLIHACGMPDIVPDLAFSPEAAAAARAALQSGAPILVDAKMVADGIIRDRLPAANRVLCTLNDAEVRPLAETLGTTRSAAAVDLWRPHLKGAVVAIGNAPTALFRLLELLDEGAAPPAVILAFPVGFVGAAESKEALIAHAGGVPYVTLRGRRGGSAFAAAAVNALSRAVQ